MILMMMLADLTGPNDHGLRGPAVQERGRTVAKQIDKVRIMGFSKVRNHPVSRVIKP